MELKTLDEIKTAAELANVYMITLSMLEKGTFHHHLLVNNMPHGEMLKCHARTEQLVVDHLKNIPDELGPAMEPGQGGLNQ
jgi:hypothetical protein